MHEYGIADRLLKEAVEAANAQGTDCVEQIVIGIGALSGLSRQALIEPLRHAAAEMGLGGVQFAFVRIEPEASCRSCGKDIGREYACPFCGSTDIEVARGADAEILEVG